MYLDAMGFAVQRHLPQLTMHWKHRSKSHITPSIYRCTMQNVVSEHRPVCSLHVIEALGPAYALSLCGKPLKKCAVSTSSCKTQRRWLYFAGSEPDAV